MSIRDRLEDARILTAAGRREGAFVQVLIAAAATSRKRYPRNKWDDSESFRNFIYDELGVITGGMKYNVAFPFRGRDTPLEDILYHHLRCQLVHEGAMPDSIEFTEPVIEETKTSSVLHLGTPLGFPKDWIDTLATAIWLAPENDELWHDEVDKRNEAREGFGDWRHSDSFCRRPGQQTKKMKGNSEKLSWTQDGLTVSVSYPPSTTDSQLAELLKSKANDLEQ